VPNIAALKSAARAAIVIPLVFALADKVIQQPQTSIIAAFGSFALLVFSEFSGPTRSRLIAYAGLACVGAVFITLGTLCSRDPLLAAGYELRVREPGHRLVRTPALDVHVHVLEPADPAVDEYLLLRDHLRRDEDDRALYERTKRELTAQDWPDMNAYADAKTDVIESIKARARSAREERAAVDVGHLS